MFDKVVSSADEAVKDIVDGSSLAVGGFGLVGVPNVLITAILRKGSKELSVVSNNCGVDGGGLGILLEAGRIRHVTASYIGTNKEFERQYLSGLIELELTPQGTLAEKMRAGGSGIPAFYTPAGVGTFVESGEIPTLFDSNGNVLKFSEPRESRTFNSKEYILEKSITTDFALVRAYIADTQGNCVFRKTAKNFNPVAAMAGKITIVEAEQVVPAGDIEPDRVHLPGIYVKRVIQLSEVESSNKGIEQYTVRNRG
ncbi:MAG: CoA transferase subunit A [Candidatus Nanopelagicaceae bacterium]